MKLDKTCAIEFQSRFGDSLDGVGLASDGGYVFAGGTSAADRHYDMAVARVAPDGQFEGGCDQFRTSGFVVYDGIVTSTPISSVHTTTTIKGVPTQLRASTPEARVKDICATR